MFSVSHSVFGSFLLGFQFLTVFYSWLLQVTSSYYRLLHATKSEHRLNNLLQVFLYPFTGGAPSKNTLLYLGEDGELSKTLVEQ